MLFVVQNTAYEKRKMKRSVFRLRFVSFPSLAGLLILSVSAVAGFCASFGSGFGRVSGTVTDANGNPLMGATIALVGSGLPKSQVVNNAVERVITDAHGRFSIEHLSPGWYSVKVASMTRMPSLRRGVRVTAGETSHIRFSLSGILAPVQLHRPDGDLMKWGEDWKWVLRTSSATRPVLRYRDGRASEAGDKPGRSKKKKRSLPPSQTVVGMMPGTSGGMHGLDPGMGGVFAYLRPLSNNSDLLMAGSMPVGGVAGPSMITAFRSNLLNDNPEEVALVVHQLSLNGSDRTALGQGIGRSQGIVLSFSQTRHLNRSISLTTGFEIDDLSATRNVTSTHPVVKLDYAASSSTGVSISYGAVRRDGEADLLDRVGDLNAFPRISMKQGRLALESDNHAEAAIRRKLGKNSSIELAAYQDQVGNAAVWASGGPEAMGALASSALSDPASGGSMLDAGNYGSMGFRAAYTRRIGDYMETVVMYSSGDALTVSSPNGACASCTNLGQALRLERSRAVGAKVKARVPGVNTLVTTSYEWMPGGRVTSVDPQGEASLGIHPFFDMEIRQPIPNIPFIPARIIAVADFRNLLAQGYVPLGLPGEEPLLLSSAYRSFRGGFSVQF